MTRIRKLLLFVDFLLVAMMAYYGYQLYGMFRESGKPLALYIIFMVFTVGIYDTMRYYKYLEDKRWFRTFVRPLCYPYCVMGEWCRLIWERIPYGKSTLKLRDPYLHNQFYYLPILSINTCLYGCILCMGWNSFGAILYNILSLVVIFFIVSLVSFSMLEIVYRLTAWLMNKLITRF